MPTPPPPDHGLRRAVAMVLILSAATLLWLLPSPSELLPTSVSPAPADAVVPPGPPLVTAPPRRFTGPPTPVTDACDDLVNMVHVNVPERILCEATRGGGITLDADGEVCVRVALGRDLPLDC